MASFRLFFEIRTDQFGFIVITLDAAGIMVAIIAGIMVIISCFGNGDSDGGGLVLLGMLDGYGLRAGGDDNNKI